MSDDDKRPKLSVVAKRSDKEFRAERARIMLDSRLRDLAANSMRVVRGAGKPLEIIMQCIAVVEAARAFEEATGYLPSDFEISQILRLKEPPQVGDDFWLDRQDARETMISGSLRIAAARLLHQSLQEDHGDKELSEGFRRLEHLYDELRKKRAAEERQARSAVKSKTKPKSKAKKPSPKRKPLRDQ